MFNSCFHFIVVHLYGDKDTGNLDVYELLEVIGVMFEKKQLLKIPIDISIRCTYSFFLQ